MNNDPSQIIFFVKKVRKPQMDDAGNIFYATTGYIVQRMKLLKLAQKYCPLILTPYGMATDVHIQETGNGLGNLAKWSTSEIIAHNLPIAQAKTMLQQHYVNLFCENKKWWNFCFHTYNEAANYALHLTAESLNISLKEASLVCSKLQAKPFKPEKPAIVERIKTDQILAKSYENLVVVHEGESFKKTLAKVKNAAPAFMDYNQLNAITRVIRAKSFKH